MIGYSNLTVKGERDAATADGLGTPRNAVRLDYRPRCLDRSAAGQAINTGLKATNNRNTENIFCFNC